MNESLKELIAELTRVDAALAHVLVADPSDPPGAPSEQLVELAAREEVLMAQLIQRASRTAAADPPAARTPLTPSTATARTWRHRPAHNLTRSA